MITLCIPLVPCIAFLLASSPMLPSLDWCTQDATFLTMLLLWDTPCKSLGPLEPRLVSVITSDENGEAQHGFPRRCKGLHVKDCLPPSLYWPKIKEREATSNLDHRSHHSAMPYKSARLVKPNPR